MNISTRVAQESDLDTCRMMDSEARAALRDTRGAAEFFASYPESVRAADTDGCTVMAVVADHGVGFATVQFMRAGTAQHGVITRMYVVPDAREVGVGDALVAAVRATASERGCAWLDALALPGDRALKNLYERNGLTARLLIASTRL